MFLMSDIENQIISSKFVKEIVSLGGNIDRFVTKYAAKMLRENLHEKAFLFIFNYLFFINKRCYCQRYYVIKINLW